MSPLLLSLLPSFLKFPDPSYGRIVPFDKLGIDVEFFQVTTREGISVVLVLGPI
jgi:hypothetical protein